MAHLPSRGDAPPPKPDDLDAAGYKELGREGVRVGRQALQVAQVTADRLEKVDNHLLEIARLLEEIRNRLPPHKEVPNDVGTV